jgi:hypothetical protein
MRPRQELVELQGMLACKAAGRGTRTGELGKTTRTTQDAQHNETAGRAVF